MTKQTIKCTMCKRQYASKSYLKDGVCNFCTEEERLNKSIPKSKQTMNKTIEDNLNTVLINNTAYYPGDVAIKELGVSRTRLSQLVKDGRIATATWFPDKGRPMYYLRADILKYIEGRNVR